MARVTVEFDTNENIDGVLDVLSKFSSQMPPPDQSSEPAKPVADESTEKPKKSGSKKKSSKKKSSKKNAEASNDETFEQADVMAALSNVNAKLGYQDAKAALQHFGVNKGSEITEDKRGAFIAHCEELLAAVS